MKVLSKSLAAMVAAATLVGGGAFAVAGTAEARKTLFNVKWEEGRLRLPALRMRLITMPLP